MILPFMLSLMVMAVQNVLSMGFIKFMIVDFVLRICTLPLPNPSIPRLTALTRKAKVAKNIVLDHMTPKAVLSAKWTL